MLDNNALLPILHSNLLFIQAYLRLSNDLFYSAVESQPVVLLNRKNVKFTTPVTNELKLFCLFYFNNLLFIDLQIIIIIISF